MENSLKEKMNNKNHSTIYIILMGTVIIILLIGFAFMSLILVDIFTQVNSLTREFIEFIERLTEI